MDKKTEADAKEVIAENPPVKEEVVAEKSMVEEATGEDTTAKEDAK